MLFLRSKIYRQLKCQLTTDVKFAFVNVPRECPKCKYKFVKTDGCNKMTCRCGAKICYICRVIIDDYTHFDQTPHHRGGVPANGRCPLYSNNNELHVQNVIAAGEKAKQELSKKGVNLKHDPTKVAPQATGAGAANPLNADYYAHLQVPYVGVNVPPPIPQAAHIAQAQAAQWHLPQFFRALWHAPQQAPQIIQPAQFNFPQAQNGLHGNRELMLHLVAVDNQQAGAHHAAAHAQAQRQRAAAQQRRAAAHVQRAAARVEAQRAATEAQVLRVAAQVHRAAAHELRVAAQEQRAAAQAQRAAAQVQRATAKQRR
jgi:hypothetical protein